MWHSTLNVTGKAMNAYFPQFSTTLSSVMTRQYLLFWNKQIHALHYHTFYRLSKKRLSKHATKIKIMFQ